MCNSLRHQDGHRPAVWPPTDLTRPEPGGQGWGGRGGAGRGSGRESGPLALTSWSAYPTLGWPCHSPWPPGSSCDAGSSGPS